MVTLIILDLLSSLSRPMNGSSRLDFLIKHAVLPLIANLEQSAPYELVGVAVCSSSQDGQFDSYVAVEFTSVRNIGKFRTGLEKIASFEFGEQCSLTQALISAQERYLSAHEGDQAPQVVFFTDAFMETTDSKATIYLPPQPFHLHIIATGEMGDGFVNIDSKASSERLPARQTGDLDMPLAGPGSIISVPLSLKGLTEAVEKLTNTHYAPFRCRITCGYLDIPVCLIPSPAQLLAKPESAIPRSISVIGFISNMDAFNSQTCTSKHVIMLDKEASSPAQAELYRYLYTAAVTDNLYPVVSLGDDWHGLIGITKQSDFYLTVWKRGVDVPWLPLFEPRGQPDEVRRPLHTALKSYQPTYQQQVMSANPEAVQMNLKKLVKLAGMLPESAERMENAISVVLLTEKKYSLTGLSDNVIAILEREKLSTSDPRSLSILSNTLSSLTGPATGFPTPSVGYPTSRISLNSLLN